MGFLKIFIGQNELKNNNMKNTYTQEEVIRIIDTILQMPIEVTDAINNESTEFDAKKLFELAIWKQ